MVSSLKLSTSTQCIKYLMFIFNLLFVITGIILVSVGSVIHGEFHNYHHFLDDNYLSVPSLLIAIGSIIFFIAFFGCCGAIRENYCMIVTFASLMVLVFILELSAGITGYVLRSNVKEIVHKKMSDSMGHLNTEIKYIWYELQQHFKCCGIDGPEDWIKKLNATDDNLPMSCCKKNIEAVGSEYCKLNNPDLIVYKEGCINAVSNFISTNAVKLGGTGLGIAFVQGMGIWFSVYLARSIKKSYQNM